MACCTETNKEIDEIISFTSFSDQKGPSLFAMGGIVEELYHESCGHDRGYGAEACRNIRQQWKLYEYQSGCGRASTEATTESACRKRTVSVVFTTIWSNIKLPLFCVSKKSAEENVRRCQFASSIG